MQPVGARAWPSSTDSMRQNQAKDVANMPVREGKSLLMLAVSTLPWQSRPRLAKHMENQKAPRPNAAADASARRTAQYDPPMT